MTFLVFLVCALLGFLSLVCFLVYRTMTINSDIDTAYNAGYSKGYTEGKLDGMKAFLRTSHEED